MLQKTQQFQSRPPCTPWALNAQRASTSNPCTERTTYGGICIEPFRPPGFRQILPAHHVVRQQQMDPVESRRRTNQRVGSCGIDPYQLLSGSARTAQIGTLPPVCKS